MKRIGLTRLGRHDRLAVGWIKRSPFQKGEVELRPIHGPDAFAPR